MNFNYLTRTLQDLLIISNDSQSMLNLNYNRFFICEFEMCSLLSGTRIYTRVSNTRKKKYKKIEECIKKKYGVKEVIITTKTE